MMTREEAIKIINCYDIGFCDLSGEKIPADKLVEAFEIAIEALKAQGRPIICPRCGRTFSEAEGRESEEIQGLEYAENVLENILREQEEGEK